MEVSTASKLFASGIAVTAVSLFTAAISFTLGTSHPRTRAFGLFALSAAGYGATEIFLVFHMDISLVPWLSRTQFACAALGIPAWFSTYKIDPKDAYLRALRATKYVSLALAALAFVPGLFYRNLEDGALSFREYAHGPPSVVAKTTMLGDAGVFVLLMILVLGVHDIAKGARRGQTGHVAELGAAGAIFLGGVNEGLVVPGYLQGYFLMTPAFGVAMAACCIATVQRTREDARNIDLLRKELERHVQERTAELDAARVSMRRAERLAAIGTLASGVAHEVNNPLSAIVANLHSLLDEPPSTGAEAFHPVLRESIDLTTRIARIVRQLLTASRTDVVVERLPVSLVVAVASALKGLSPEIRAHGTVTSSVADVWVLGDETHLTQILSNLLSNALQAVEGAAERAVHVSTISTGATVEVRVKDTGHGIPDTVRNRLFEAFVTTKRAGQGTGLGLAITHELVHALGGQIRTESTGPDGTTFLVTLEAATAAASAATTQKPELPPNASGPLPRVLLVDDEVAVRKAIRRMLATRFEVVVAADTSDALNALAANRDFHAVLCDVVMPDGGGERLHAALHEQQSPYAGRLFFMTGGAPDEQTRRFLASVRCPVLQKPFRRDDVVEALSSFPPPDAS